MNTADQPGSTDSGTDSPNVTGPRANESAENEKQGSTNLVARDIFLCGALGAFTPQVLKWQSHAPTMGTDLVALAGAIFATISLVALCGFVTTIWSVRNRKEAFFVGLALPTILFSTAADFKSIANRATNDSTMNSAQPPSGYLDRSLDRGIRYGVNSTTTASTETSIAVNLLDNILPPASASSDVQVGNKGESIIQVSEADSVQRFFKGFSSVFETSTTTTNLGNTWELLPGAAHDIGIGADHSVWVIGTNPVPGGFGIYRWATSKWQQIDGGAVRIAVDSRGNPWVVNDKGRIFQRVDNRWEKRSGTANDIGIGADGSVWVIGTNPVNGGFGIYRWASSKWQQIDGGAVRIAVDPRGNPWVVNDNDIIFQRTSSGWQRRPGRARDIGIGADDSIWVIGTNPVGGGFGIYRWNGVNWTAVAGGAVSVSVGPAGYPWVVNSGNRIYRRI